MLDESVEDDVQLVGVRWTAEQTRVVHRLVLFEIRPESLDEVSRLDPEHDGFECFSTPGIDRNFHSDSEGAAAFSYQQLSSWTPGVAPHLLPERSALRLKAGSRFVMQVHYRKHTALPPLEAHPSAELYFDRDPRLNQALWLPVTSPAFVIAAGARPDADASPHAAA